MILKLEPFMSHGINIFESVNDFNLIENLICDTISMISMQYFSIIWTNYSNDTDSMILPSILLCNLQLRCTPNFVLIMNTVSSKFKYFSILFIILLQHVATEYNRKLLKVRKLTKEMHQRH